MKPGHPFNQTLFTLPINISHLIFHYKKTQENTPYGVSDHVENIRKETIDSLWFTHNSDNIMEDVTYCIPLRRYSHEYLYNPKGSM